MIKYGYSYSKKVLSGNTTPEPNGFSSIQLAECLEVMCSYPNVACLGVASMPTLGDPDGASIRAFYRIIEGVIKGYKKRNQIQNLSLNSLIRMRAHVD